MLIKIANKKLKAIANPFILSINSFSGILLNFIVSLVKH